MTHFAAALFISLAVLPAAQAQQNKAKPTGACTISVYGISPTCYSSMTQDSCYATAKKVGGSADWQEGKTCSKK